jgi:hypothetical protein
MSLCRVAFFPYYGYVLLGCGESSTNFTGGQVLHYCDGAQDAVP